MKISAAIVCLAGLIVPVARAEEPTLRIVRVRGNAANIRALVCSSAQIFCQVSDPLRAIVVRGLPAQVDEAERAIKELDELSIAAAPKSAKNIESTVYVIAGSNEAVPGAQEVSGDALAPVVKQLRTVFPYSHYQLLSSMMLRSAEDSGSSSTGLMKGAATSPGLDQPRTYEISFESAKVSSDSVATIHLQKFRFETFIPIVSGALTGKDVPTSFNSSKMLVFADLDLHENQKVVVGKANVSNSDTCYFIVVSARLVP